MIFDLIDAVIEQALQGLGVEDQKKKDIQKKFDLEKENLKKFFDTQNINDREKVFCEIQKLVQGWGVPTDLLQKFVNDNNHSGSAAILAQQILMMMEDDRKKKEAEDLKLKLAQQTESNEAAWKEQKARFEARLTEFKDDKNKAEMVASATSKKLDDLNTQLYKISDKIEEANFELKLCNEEIAKIKSEYTQRNADLNFEYVSTAGDPARQAEVLKKIEVLQKEEISRLEPFQDKISTISKQLVEDQAKQQELISGRKASENEYKVAEANVMLEFHKILSEIDETEKVAIASGNEGLVKDCQIRRIKEFKDETQRILNDNERKILDKTTEIEEARNDLAKKKGLLNGNNLGRIDKINIEDKISRAEKRLNTLSAEKSTLENTGAQLRNKLSNYNEMQEAVSNSTLTIENGQVLMNGAAPPAVRYPTTTFDANNPAYYEPPIYSSATASLTVAAAFEYLTPTAPAAEISQTPQPSAPPADLPEDDSKEVAAGLAAFLRGDTNDSDSAAVSPTTTNSAVLQQPQPSAPPAELSSNAETVIPAAELPPEEAKAGDDSDMSAALASTPLNSPLIKDLLREVDAPDAEEAKAGDEIDMPAALASNPLNSPLTRDLLREVDAPDADEGDEIGTTVNPEAFTVSESEVDNSDELKVAGEDDIASPPSTESIADADEDGPLPPIPDEIDPALAAEAKTPFEQLKDDRVALETERKGLNDRLNNVQNRLASIETELAVNNSQKSNLEKELTATNALQPTDDELAALRKDVADLDSKKTRLNKEEKLKLIEMKKDLEVKESLSANITKLNGKLEDLREVERTRNNEKNRLSNQAKDINNEIALAGVKELELQDRESDLSPSLSEEQKRELSDTRIRNDLNEKNRDNQQRIIRDSDQAKKLDEEVKQQEAQLQKYKNTVETTKKSQYSEGFKAQLLTNASTVIAEREKNLAELKEKRDELLKPMEDRQALQKDSDKTKEDNKKKADADDLAAAAAMVPKVSVAAPKPAEDKVEKPKKEKAERKFEAKPYDFSSRNEDGFKAWLESFLSMFNQLGGNFVKALVKGGAKLVGGTVAMVATAVPAAIGGTMLAAGKLLKQDPNSKLMQAGQKLVQPFVKSAKFAGADKLGRFAVGTAGMVVGALPGLAGLAAKRLGKLTNNEKLQERGESLTSLYRGAKRMAGKAAVDNIWFKEIVGQYVSKEATEQKQEAPKAADPAATSPSAPSLEDVKGVDVSIKLSDALAAPTPSAPPLSVRDSNGNITPVLPKTPLDPKGNFLPPNVMAELVARASNVRKAADIQSRNPAADALANPTRAAVAPAAAAKAPILTMANTDEEKSKSNFKAQRAQFAARLAGAEPLQDESKQNMGPGR